MKKFINKLLFSILILSGQWSMVNGQATTAIPYQGVARNAAGNIVANRTISLRFSILQGGALGTLVYQETHSPTTNSLGLFDVKITGGNSTTGVFDPTKWKVLAAAGAFLKVELDINGGSAFVDMGTTQLLSVPFAMYAASTGSSDALKADKVTAAVSGNFAGLDGTGNLVDGGRSPNDYLDKGNTTAYTPASNYNPATKKYVDDATAAKADKVSGAVSGNFAGLDGTGNLVDGGRSPNDYLDKGNTTAYTPASNYNPATKKYVDDATAAKADKVSGAVSGNFAGLSASGNLVDGGRSPNDYLDKGNTTVYTPASNYNPATKKYVDDADASAQVQVNGKVSRSGDTMTGLLVLSADPATAKGAATKQYVDAADAAKADKVSGAVNGNFAGLSASGNLVDGGRSPNDYLDKGNTTAYTPASNYNPATKKYVDDATAAKADKVVGATNGNFATLTANGNLSDGGERTAGNIGFSPTTSITSTNVQAAITEVDGRFGTLIDSYIHRTEDGVSIYLPPSGTRKRFGIGDTAPESPLGISSEGSEQRVLTIKPGTLSSGPTYSFRLNSAGSSGFDLEEEDLTVGNSSRLFILQSSGYVGIGTIQPSEKLHIENSTPGGLTGIKIVNTATTSNQGWLLGHINDASVTDRNGAFAFFENDVAGGKTERITILPGGRVGINETIPDTKLHVSRSLSDPNADINLSSGTGIAVFGPIVGQNLGLDSHQIQARTGSYSGAGSTVSLTATTLGLQPRGGDIVIHSSTSSDKQIQITDDGKIGLGKTPIERLDVNGAVTFGDTETTSPAEGTVRWHGNPAVSADLEVFKNGIWKSLTTQSVTEGFGAAGTNKITYNAADAKVGIGISVPTSALHVYTNEGFASSNSAAAFIHSESATSSTSFSDTRIGIEIKNSSQWSANADARNIGIFVSGVSGQASREANLAAILNGNVVIGGLTASKVVGSNGTNVLAIQTGSIPLSPPGSTTTGGIQIYSDDISSGAVSPPVSIFHLMNGDGTTIKLFRGDALPAPDNSTISSTTYGATEEAVIKNMRDRINQLETRLQALGLLQ